MVIKLTTEQTIGEIEKKYGVKFNVNPRMKLSTYLKRNGLKSLAKLLSRIYGKRS